MKIKKIKYIDSGMILDQTKEISVPVIIESVGFVIKETEEYITLAGEILEDGDYRNQISIPKVAIIK